MAWSIGTRRGVVCAAVALALSLPAGAARADAPTAPPQITEVGGKTLDKWIADLKKEDPSVREEAIRAIVLFPNAGEAVPALIDRLHDPDESPRIKAVLALGAIKIDDKQKADIVKAINQRLDDESQGPIRYDLALVLMGFGKDAKGALPGLLHRAEDPSCFEVRRICIAVAAQAGMTDNGPDPSVTHVLVRLLLDNASQVRLQAMMGLAQMGKPADADLLTHELAAVRNVMAKDRDKTVVIWAHLSMMALSKIDDDDIKYLTDCAGPVEIDRIRVQAIGALGMVGTKEKKVVPTLVGLLSDKEPAIVAAACQALGGIGDPGDAAEKALIAVCKDDKIDEEVRVQAIYALAMVGPKGKAAIPALIDLMKTDKDPNVVMTVCHALGSLEEPGALAEQAITDLARSKDVSESVRKYAEKILETLAKPKGK